MAFSISFHLSTLRNAPPEPGRHFRVHGFVFFVENPFGSSGGVRVHGLLGDPCILLHTFVPCHVLMVSQEIIEMTAAIIS